MQTLSDITANPELIQRARDIAADAFISCSMADALGVVARSHNGSFGEFGRHIDEYARFMREGAYDSDMAVRAALMALTEAQRGDA